MDGRVPELTERNLRQSERFVAMSEQICRTSRALRVVDLPVDVSGVMRMSGREMRGVTAMRVGGAFSAMLDQLMQDRTDANRARQCEA